MSESNGIESAPGTVSEDVNPLLAEWSSELDGIDFSIIPPDEKKAFDETKPARHSKPAAEDRARSGPPTLEEWEGFFSRFVIRALTEWYLTYAFKGVDEDQLSQREINKLRMTDEERKRIVIPFAELSNKVPIMRKHGRLIVSSGESIDAALTLGIWFSRVNRVAAKYRPIKVKAVRKEDNGSVSTGQSTAESNGHGEYVGGIPIIIHGDD